MSSEILAVIARVEEQAVAVWDDFIVDGEGPTARKIVSFGQAFGVADQC